MPRILITRPRTDADRLEQQLVDAGYHVHSEPLLEIMLQRSNIQLSPPPRAIVLTSHHAVHAVRDHPQWLDAHFFVVGETASRALQALGAAQIVTAQDMDALKPLLHASLKAGDSVLYLRGEHVAHALSEVLPMNVNLTQITVYRAQAAARWSEAFLRALPFDAALFFSARTAQVFSALAQSLPEDAWRHSTAFVLSNTIATALAPAFRDIVVSDAPTQASLLEAMDNRLRER
jgi:uroporphyrinogen-III synthase